MSPSGFTPTFSITTTERHLMAQSFHPLGERVIVRYRLRAFADGPNQ